MTTPTLDDRIRKLRSSVPADARQAVEQHVTAGMVAFLACRRALEKLRQEVLTHQGPEHASTDYLCLTCCRLAEDLAESVRKLDVAWKPLRERR